MVLFGVILASLLDRLEVHSTPVVVCQSNHPTNMSSEHPNI